MNIAPWQNLLDTLGWTLLHSLWQLSLIAAISALARLAFPKSSSQARYLLAYLSLLAMIATPIATYAYLWSHQNHSITVAPSAETIGFSNAAHYEIIDSGPHILTMVPPPADTWQTIVKQLHALAPFAAVGYLLGALALMVRLLLGYRALRQICITALPAPQHDTLLAALRDRLRIVQPVLLKLSPRVEVPTVIGAFRPMILLPLTALTGLSTEQLTHLLLHELAHIRRHDYLANLLQSIIETLLFYHPAVLWISAQIRQEREHCCDDLAIAAAGNRARYAESLATMESLRASPILSMSARGGSLLPRIRRILKVSVPHSPAQRIISGFSLGIAAFLITTTFFFLGMDTPPSSPATRKTDTVTKGDSAATAPADHPAQTGDTLAVFADQFLIPTENYAASIDVDENGNIQLPRIGKLSVVGKNSRQIADAISHAITDRALLTNPRVRVSYSMEHADLRPLQVGDKISVSIFEIESAGKMTNSSCQINSDGTVTLPHFARTHVAGLTPTQAAARFAASAADELIISRPVYVRVCRDSIPPINLTLVIRSLFVDSSVLDASVLDAIPDLRKAQLQLVLLTDEQLTVLLDRAPRALSYKNNPTQRVGFYQGQQKMGFGDDQHKIEGELNWTFSKDRQSIVLVARSTMRSGEKKEHLVSDLSVTRSVVVPDKGTAILIWPAAITSDDALGPKGREIQFFRPRINPEKTSKVEIK